MTVKVSQLSVPKDVMSVVVRPVDGVKGGVPCGGASQTLVVFAKEIHELLEIPHGDSAADAGLQPQQQLTKVFCLSEQRLPVAGQLRCITDSVYEPTSHSVFLVEDFKVIKQLDCNNVLGLVAGSEGRTGLVDGRGKEALFGSITAMAADGKGNVFVADEGVGAADEQHPGILRVVRAGEVVSLRGTERPGGLSKWVALSYDAAADVLVAATRHAVYHVLMYGSPASSLGLAAATRLVAGREKVLRPGKAEADGRGEAARFKDICAILAGTDNRVYVLDNQALRTVEADGTVSTMLRLDCGDSWGLSSLPSGELTVSMYGIMYDDQPQSALSIISCAGFAPSCQVLAGWRRMPRRVPNLSELLRVPVNADAHDCGVAGAAGGCNPSCEGSGGHAAARPVVTVRVDGGAKAFTAHRSVLAAGSEYFRQLLQPDGGFGDSGSDEVSVPDAHPDAFGVLLSHAYTGVLPAVPDELMHPVAELAGRLLMPTACTKELQSRLLATVTPGSVVSELMWAERHGLPELVAQLKSYLLRNRREVLAEANWQQSLKDLLGHFPDLSDEMLSPILRQQA